MSSRDVCITTCDRCRATTERPTHNTRGERNGLPDGWHHVTTRPQRLDIDVCPACFATLWTALVGRCACRGGQP